MAEDAVYSAIVRTIGLNWWNWENNRGWHSEWRSVHWYLYKGAMNEEEYTSRPRPPRCPPWRAPMLSRECRLWFTAACRYLWRYGRYSAVFRSRSKFYSP